MLDETTVVHPPTTRCGNTPAFEVPQEDALVIGGTMLHTIDDQSRRRQSRPQLFQLNYCDSRSGHTALTQALSSSSDGDYTTCEEEEDVHGSYGDDTLDEEEKYREIRSAAPIFNIHASILGITTSDEDDDDDDDEGENDLIFNDDHPLENSLLMIHGPRTSPLSPFRPSAAAPKGVEESGVPPALTWSSSSSSDMTGGKAMMAATSTETSTSIMDRVGDYFLLDGLCASSPFPSSSGLCASSSCSSRLSDQHQTCVVRAAAGPSTNVGDANTATAGITESKTTPNHHAAVAAIEQHFVQLMGCLPPTNVDDENEETRHMFGKQNSIFLRRLFCIKPGDDDNRSPPRRCTDQQRRRKIRQLLTDRHDNGRHSHHHDDDAVLPLRTVQSSLLYRQKKRTTTTSTTTMAKRQPRYQYRQDDEATTTVTTAIGYDSDPEHLVWSDRQQRIRRTKPHQRSIIMAAPVSPPVSVNAALGLANVEMTLNTSWDLFWHHNNDHRHITPCAASKSTTPQSVHVWLERGTLIHANHMIEPRIMWRTDAMHAPVRSVWLLHVARIRACDDPNEITTTDPLPLFLQPSTSFCVRTHDERFYFQAKDKAARDAIVTQWKAAIARFAALAVLEDATAILHEFFVTNQPPHVGVPPAQWT
jgi:hypothetical protein